MFDILNDNYSACLFLRTGGHFVRLLIGLRSLIEKEFDQIYVQPKNRIVTVIVEMKDYLLCAYKNTHDPSAKQLAQYTSDLNELFCILNGPLHVFAHHSLLPVVDLQSLKDRLYIVLCRIIFPGQPGVPAANKWEKFGPTLDWHSRAHLWGLMPKVMRYAFGPMLLQVRGGDKTFVALEDAQDPEVDDNPDKDPEAVAEFRKKVGKRFRRFCKMQTSTSGEMYLSFFPA